MSHRSPLGGGGASLRFALSSVPRHTRGVSTGKIFPGHAPSRVRFFPGRSVGTKVSVVGRQRWMEGVGGAE